MDLRTDKILLRAVEPGDAELMMQWENDRSYWYVSGTTSPLPAFMIEEFVKPAYQDIHINKQLRLVIEVLHNKSTIGYVDLYDVDFINRRAGVGLVVGNTSQRGKGYASHALNLTKQYVFEILNLHQLHCYIHKSNTVSIHLFEKAGFEKCGVLKQWSLRNNVFEDVIAFQCINQNVYQ